VNEVPVRSAAGDASAATPTPGGGASAGGCLRAAGRLALILGALVVLGFVALYLSLQQSFKAPQAVSAPIAWTTHAVVLSADHPIAHGRLTFTAKASPTNDLRVGVNAGVPTTEAQRAPSGSAATSPSQSDEPAALLSGPVVRLTAATALGAPQSCLAPCELPLPSQLECGSGTCHLDFDVTVELIPDSAGIRGKVTVGVAGGATAPLDKHLPDGLVVELALDGAVISDGS
jgi:hypothetical protein